MWKKVCAEIIHPQQQCVSKSVLETASIIFTVVHFKRLPIMQFEKFNFRLSVFCSRGQLHEYYVNGEALHLNLNKVLSSPWEA